MTLLNDYHYKILVRPVHAMFHFLSLFLTIQGMQLLITLIRKACVFGSILKSQFSVVGMFVYGSWISRRKETFLSKSY